MSKLGKEHWTTVKRVFIYLCGTTDYVIYYQGIPRLDIVINLHGVIYVEWDGDLDHRRLIDGYVFKLFEEKMS